MSPHPATALQQKQKQRQIHGKANTVVLCHFKCVPAPQWLPHVTPLHTQSPLFHQQLLGGQQGTAYVGRLPRLRSLGNGQVLLQHQRSLQRSGKGDLRGSVKAHVWSVMFAGGTVTSEEACLEPEGHCTQQRIQC